MKMSFRWYGKHDPVSLEEIKAIPGMQGMLRRFTMCRLVKLGHLRIFSP
ncbi:D-mannonate dehydratase family protein [Streptococcus pyogenes MGAS2111]|nr:D-mannonate dehydratase family protein [Streptococcus pyogenes MGAS2111]